MAGTGLLGLIDLISGGSISRGLESRQIKSQAAAEEAAREANVRQSMSGYSDDAIRAAIAAQNLERARLGLTNLGGIPGAQATGVAQQAANKAGYNAAEAQNRYEQLKASGKQVGATNLGELMTSSESDQERAARELARGQQTQYALTNWGANAEAGNAQRAADIQEMKNRLSQLQGGSPFSLDIGRASGQANLNQALAASSASKLAAQGTDAAHDANLGAGLMIADYKNKIANSNLNAQNSLQALDQQLPYLAAATTAQGLNTKLYSPETVAALNKLGQQTALSEASRGANLANIANKISASGAIPNYLYPRVTSSAYGVSPVGFLDAYGMQSLSSMAGQPGAGNLVNPVTGLPISTATRNPSPPGTPPPPPGQGGPTISPWETLQIK